MDKIQETLSYFNNINIKELDSYDELYGNLTQLENDLKDFEYEKNNYQKVQDVLIHFQLHLFNNTFDNTSESLSRKIEGIFEKFNEKLPSNYVGKMGYKNFREKLNRNDENHLTCRKKHNLEAVNKKNDLKENAKISEQQNDNANKTNDSILSDAKMKIELWRTQLEAFNGDKNNEKYKDFVESLEATLQNLKENKAMTQEKRIYQLQIEDMLRVYKQKIEEKSSVDFEKYVQNNLNKNTGNPIPTFNLLSTHDRLNHVQKIVKVELPKEVEKEIVEDPNITQLSVSKLVNKFNDKSKNSFDTTWLTSNLKKNDKKEKDVQITIEKTSDKKADATITSNDDRVKYEILKQSEKKKSNLKKKTNDKGEGDGKNYSESEKKDKKEKSKIKKLLAEIRSDLEKLGTMFNEKQDKIYVKDGLTDLEKRLEVLYIKYDFRRQVKEKESLLNEIKAYLETLQESNECKEHNNTKVNEKDAEESDVIFTAAEEDVSQEGKEIICIEKQEEEENINLDGVYLVPEAGMSHQENDVKFSKIQEETNNEKCDDKEEVSTVEKGNDLVERKEDMDEIFFATEEPVDQNEHDIGYIDKQEVKNIELDATEDNKLLENKEDIDAHLQSKNDEETFIAYEEASDQKESDLIEINEESDATLLSTPTEYSDKIFVAFEESVGPEENEVEYADKKEEDKTKFEDKAIGDEQEQDNTTLLASENISSQQEKYFAPLKNMEGNDANIQAKDKEETFIASEEVVGENYAQSKVQDIHEAFDTSRNEKDDKSGNNLAIVAPEIPEEEDITIDYDSLDSDIEETNDMPVKFLNPTLAHDAKNEDLLSHEEHDKYDNDSLGSDSEDKFAEEEQNIYEPNAYDVHLTDSLGSIKEEEEDYDNDSLDSEANFEKEVNVQSNNQINTPSIIGGILKVNQKEPDEEFLTADEDDDSLNNEKTT